MSADDFTIGVEEEYQIIHPETREPAAARRRDHARGISDGVGEEVTNELYLSQIEIGTPVCRTLADVRAELVRLRRARDRGGRPATAAGSPRPARTRSRTGTPRR